jgi:16S rRNA (guanine527-N7)-methyltransferase
MLITDEKGSIDFLKTRLDLSEFTLLEMYSKIVSEESKFLNLISKNTISQIWQRHILDSYQLINYIDKDDEVVDIGSGAGFPGIVLKIL